LSGGPVCYGYKPLVLYRVDAFSDEFTGFFFALAGFGKAYFRIDTDGKWWRRRESNPRP
jgi:hypothetical protein